MNTPTNSQKILSYITLKTEVGYAELLEYCQDMNESTLVRNLSRLVQTGALIKKKQGKHTSYQISTGDLIRKYLDRPFFDRPPQSYDFTFLDSYQPNHTSFLWDRYALLQSECLDRQILSTYDYRTNIRAIENLLIDLSFASSRLEGNTYSYLDTEILIKYHTTPEGKTSMETQMILNHKEAIKYLIENRMTLMYSRLEFQNLHTLLGKWLLIDEYLGQIRTHAVSIGGSAYTPLENHFQLSEQFDLFLEKLRQIQNPFEQAIFILVFIPYFQIFMDINKRTSRIAANIPLLQNGLLPFSFLRISDRDYINAILAVYELRDTSLMAEMFVSNYLLNMHRYV